MNNDERITKRGWCIDYALRLRPPKATSTAEKIIRDAQKFERYIFDTKPAAVIQLASTDKK